MVLSEAQEQHLEVLRAVFSGHDKYTAIAMEPDLAQVYVVMEKAEIYFDANNDRCLYTLKPHFIDAARERAMVVLATRGAVDIDLVLTNDDIDGALDRLVD